MMGMAEIQEPGNSYDAVPYTSNPMPHTHPDRLATVAKLFGLPAAPVERCRVLELGCASGGNLIPMAQDLPESRFVGVDYSEVQIREGNATVEALGLKNIELRHASILDIDASYGTFDYIICHGVYSWVPAPVREKILEIAGTMLAPDGVAYISYNTYPGWHMRGVVRDMMRYHAMRFEEPGRRVQEARLILDCVAKFAVGQNAGPYSAFLRSEAELLRPLGDDYLYHEHLEDESAPLYFHQFVELARKKGLDYLGEATLGTMSPANFGSQVQPALRAIATNAIELEQFMDFLSNRAFRQTLLHRARRVPQYTLAPQVVWPMYVTSGARSESDPVDLAAGAGVVFKSQSGSRITTPYPLLKAALLVLGEAWPDAIRFDELLELSRQRLGRSAHARSDADQDRLELGAALLTVFTSSDLIELSACAPRFTTRAGERPLASPLARHQAASGNVVTTRRHDRTRLRPMDVRVIQLLDGKTAVARVAGRLGADGNEVAASVERIARSALLCG